jgi:hypothetical protein
MAARDTCSTCKYFRAQLAGPVPIGQVYQGGCVRFPPQIAGMNPQNGTIMAAHPPTRSDGWCGEHEPGIIVGG